MYIPEYLQKGDTILFIAPARHLDLTYINKAKQLLEQEGYRVQLGEHVGCVHHRFAGADAERLLDLQWALDHQQAKAIFCIRGGYGSIRIIEHADFTAFTKKPKWLIGFSDITILHAKISQLQIASLHGMMPLTMAQLSTDNNALRRTISCLSGHENTYNLAPSPLNISGSVTARLVGGNLTIMHSLMGTPFQVPFKNKILFIEDVGDHIYRFDRILFSLKQQGVFKHIKGLVVGVINDLQETPEQFGMGINELIYEKVMQLNIPVAFGFPGGHIKDNYPLVLSKETQLIVNHTNVEIVQ